MPGVYATDALAPNLLSGSTLGSAASSTGTVVDIGWPGDVVALLKTSTVTGTTPTLNVRLQGSSTAAFTGGTIVELGTFQNATATGQTFKLPCRVGTQYIRAQVVTGGTTPVFTGSTLQLQLQDYHRTLLDSAGPVS